MSVLRGVNAWGIISDLKRTPCSGRARDTFAGISRHPETCVTTALAINRNKILILVAHAFVIHNRASDRVAIRATSLDIRWVRLRISMRGRRVVGLLEENHVADNISMICARHVMFGSIALASNSWFHLDILL